MSTDNQGSQAQQTELWEELTVKSQWFHVMRTDILDNVIAEMGTNAWAVYCIIKAYTNMKTGESYPSQALIAKHMGCSVDTVDRATKRLLELGKIKLEKRGRSNVYRTIDSVQLVSKEGRQLVSTAQKPYVPMEFQSFIKELEAYAASGQLGTNANFQVTFNITQVTGEHANVTINNVTTALSEDPARRAAVQSALDVVARGLTNKTRALRNLDFD